MNIGCSLQIRQLFKIYQPGISVLKGIDLDFADTGLTAIIGPSGSGKSTLLRCINRLVEPTSGDIQFLGQSVIHLPAKQLRQLRRSIGMVFQEHHLVERLTVVENVLCGRLGYTASFKIGWHQFSTTDIDKAYSLIEGLGLAKISQQRASNLSGGERQRVGIARALMQEPQILLADEPTASLDPRTATEIMALVADLAAKRSIPVIVNMHNVALAKRFCSRLIGLFKGEIVFDGEPSQLTDNCLEKIYGSTNWLE